MFDERGAARELEGVCGGPDAHGARLPADVEQFHDDAVAVVGGLCSRNHHVLVRVEQRAILREEWTGRLIAVRRTYVERVARCPPAAHRLGYIAGGEQRNPEAEGHRSTLRCRVVRVPIVVHRIGEQRPIGDDTAPPRATEQIVEREERRVRPAPENAVGAFVQPNPVRVAVPIPAATGLLIAIYGHPPEGNLDFHGGLGECEREGDVERLFCERRRLRDPILDVDPRQLVVERDDRGDRRKAFQHAIHDEADANPGEPFATTPRELGLGEVELRRILEVVAVARGPQRAVLAATGVDQLIQPRPRRGLHALLAVRTRE